jgi:hypothetical protein
MALHNTKTTPKQQQLRSVSSHNGFQRQAIVGRTFSKTHSPSAKDTLRASAAAELNRKASLHALSGTMPVTPSAMAGNLEIGDTVNVPGEMYGTVRFVGSVRGKAGRFVGVELDREFAAKGKNDGDVEGYALGHARGETYTILISSIAGRNTSIPLFRELVSSCQSTAPRDALLLEPPIHTLVHPRRRRTAR